MYTHSKLYPDVPPHGRDGDGLVGPVPLVRVPVSTIDVTIPHGVRAGGIFSFPDERGNIHRMTVPRGTFAGQVVTVVVQPAAFAPGEQMVVRTHSGLMVVTVAPVPPGSVIIINLGHAQRPWKNDERGESLSKRCGGRRLWMWVLCISLLLLLAAYALFSFFTMPEMRPYAYGHVWLNNDVPGAILAQIINVDHS